MAVDLHILGRIEKSAVDLLVIAGQLAQERFVPAIATTDAMFA